MTRRLALLITMILVAGGGILARTPDVPDVTKDLLPGEALDILYDGQTFTEFRSRRIDRQHTHGTGCTLSATIAAGLAKGRSMAESVASAKEYITRAIESGLPLGSGHGPVNHLVRPPSDP